MDMMSFQDRPMFFLMFRFLCCDPRHVMKIVSFEVTVYLLVNQQFAMENMAIEFVDLPIKEIVIVHAYLSFPEGNRYELSGQL